MQKPVKKSHFEGIKEIDKINNYLVDIDRDMFNFYQYFVNFPKVYRQSASPTLGEDGIALWEDTDDGKFYWVVRINGVQKTLDFASSSSGIVNHAALSNLDYSSAGHTGFEPSMTTGNLTSFSPISIAGGNGAVTNGGAIVSIAKADTNNNGYVSNSDWGTFYNKADYVFGANAFSGTGNFITTGTLSANTLIASAIIGKSRITTGNDSINDNDYLVTFANAATCSLLASPTVGRQIMIKNISTGNVTLNSGGTDTIDGSTRQVIYSNEGFFIMCSTDNAWVVV